MLPPPASDSAGEDNDPLPEDKARSRRRPWASPTIPSLALPANNHRQADGCGDTCGPSSGKSGMQPGDQGQDGPPRSSPWVSMDKEQEDEKWRAVMMGTASSLADIHLLCMAALGEVISGPSQGDPGTGTMAQPDQCRRPQVE